ncbi:hypothetical protein L7F22_048117 [Adiantum nelumboides]|nr:hypothetical protein [Adiantum nelumboides]
MHRVFDGEDPDDIVEDLDGAADYLSDKREDEEVEESNIFLPLVAIAVIQHALVTRRRLDIERYGEDGEKLSTTIKGKQVVGMQKVALDPMTHTWFIKMVMKEFFQSWQQEEPMEVESNDSESKSYQGSGGKMVAAFDPNKEETQIWIKCISLYEFACLPWDAWAENEFAEQRRNMIKEAEGLIAGDVRLTLKLVSKDLEEPDSKVKCFSMGSELKKSESKGKKITLFPTGIVGFCGGEECSEKFIGQGSQDEALRVLENAKQEHKCSVVSKGEMEKINMQLLQEKSDRKKLQEEVVRLQAKVDEQFKELDEKVAAVTTENVLLINRLSPLAEMEKAILQGQGMIGVLVADFDADALKKEVLEYAQEMWNRATKLWREHMALLRITKAEVEKQADPNFVVEKAMEPDGEGDIGDLIKELWV